MKRIFLMTVGLVVLLAAFAQAQTTPAPAPAPQPRAAGANFVDANGDGICDRFQAGVGGQGAGRQLGPRDGTGQKLRQRDGTGRGVGPGAGTGVCDGTGPKGRGRRGGR